ncbi:MAG: HD domain-containing protein [Deltaproteobacteria bacterium]|jgi:GTP pyrophosphokinase|nr:HD domain-containing protein [Deltaproteobacteria bacterium]
MAIADDSADAGQDPWRKRPPLPHAPSRGGESPAAAIASSPPESFLLQAPDVNSVTDLYLAGHPGRGGLPEDVELLRRSYAWTGAACGGALRIGGEPYLARPLATANALAAAGLDAATVASGLLKEPLETGRAAFAEIRENFGEEVAALAAGAADPPGERYCLTASSPWDGVGFMASAAGPAYRYASPEGAARRAARFALALEAALRDPRTLAVRIASRLHDMRCLPLYPPSCRAAYAQETLDYYAPLAGALGLPKLRSDLEDLSLMTLRPKDYADISSRLPEGPPGREGFVRETGRALQASLREFRVDCEVRGRAKHVYGVWRKMLLQNLPFEQIHDLFAFRVTVDSVEACYRALGVVHTLYRPLPGRFKDYISLPAQDGYRSLHTAVVGPRGVRMEIRIGSAGMRGRRGDDAEAVLDLRPAVARPGGLPAPGLDAGLRYLRSLHAALTDGMDRDPDASLSRLRKALDPDGPVLAFTPMNGVVKLPQGATPIDFAYRIHPGLGDRLAAAFVNGSPVGLGHTLGSLSTVRIVTDTSARPAGDWLDKAASPKTRAMIRKALSSARERPRPGRRRPAS